MRHVISALVMNEPGVLANVAGMFAARGFNIDSLVVGRTESPELSRMTVVVDGDENVVEQVRKQLAKLVPVVKVRDFTGSAYIERDLALITVSCPSEKRSELTDLVDLFRAKVVDVSRDTLMGVQPEPPPASTDDDGPIQPMRVLEPAASQDDPEPSTEAPRATVDTEPPPPPVAMPSEHPLAALGLSSRPPAPPAASTPTADIMDSSSDDAPSGVVETTGRIAPAPPLQSAPESSLAPPAIEREENEDRSNQTSSDLAPESAPVAATDATHPESEPPMESLAPSAPASTIDQLAQSLMADLAGRLAPSLEKRIFELVAERVAERLAEQVLANMGAGGKHTAPARRPSPQADAPASDSAQDEAQPVKRSTRPRKKASSAS